MRVVSPNLLEIIEVSLVKNLSTRLEWHNLSLIDSVQINGNFDSFPGSTILILDTYESNTPITYISSSIPMGIIILWASIFIFPLLVFKKDLFIILKLIFKTSKSSKRE